MYTRLSFIEREEISRQLAYGNTIRRISIILKRSPSTISREITLTTSYIANIIELTMGSKDRMQYDVKIDENEN